MACRLFMLWVLSGALLHVVIADQLPSEQLLRLPDATTVDARGQSQVEHIDPSSPEPIMRGERKVRIKQRDRQESLESEGPLAIAKMKLAKDDVEEQKAIVRASRLLEEEDVLEQEDMIFQAKSMMVASMFERKASPAPHPALDPSERAWKHAEDTGHPPAPTAEQKMSKTLDWYGYKYDRKNYYAAKNPEACKLCMACAANSACTCAKREHFGTVLKVNPGLAADYQPQGCGCDARGKKWVSSLDFFAAQYNFCYSVWSGCACDEQKNWCRTDWTALGGVQSGPEDYVCHQH